MRNFGTTDVLIVGGGPAGLAAAIALRQRGIAVTVSDSVKPPIDKACGEGLMPDSLHELARLGVELTPADGAAFRRIRFVHGDDVATAAFPAGVGMGVRRQSLHSRLVARAEEAGVTLLWQSPVQLLENGEVRIAGEAAHYCWLIGADGQSSRVRRWAGLEDAKTISRRFGFRRHYQIAPWSSFVEVHWGRSGQAYVTPTGANEVCVAAVVGDPQCRLDALLEELPELHARLGGLLADPADRERGAVTTTRRLHRVVTNIPLHGRVALVGDASGSADAVTGDGMGMAIRQALLLADCIEAENPVRYNQLHSETLRLPQMMARVLLLMDRSAIFRSRAIRMLAAQPPLFARMLGVHVGAEPLTKFVAAKGFELAWQLAIPRSRKRPSVSRPAPAKAFPEIL
jgi:flavin-dependent dehydrogenase